MKLPEGFKVSSDKYKQMIFESLKYIQIMHYLHQLFKEDPLLLVKPISIPDKVDLLYLALILPYTNYKCIHKGKLCKVYEYIISNGFKVHYNLTIET